MDGWIKIYRQILKHWVFENPIYLKLWIYLLLETKYEPSKVLIGSKLIELEPGEILISIRNYAKKCHCGVRQIRTFLELCEADKMINIKTTHQTTHITINNFKDFQQSTTQLTTQSKNDTVTTQLTTNNFNDFQKIATQLRHSSDTVATQSGESIIYFNKKKEIKNIRREKNNFKKPSLDEIKNFISENNYPVDPEKFFNYYTANGWKVGKNPMKDWQAAVRTWVRTSTTNNNIDISKNNITKGGVLSW